MRVPSTSSRAIHTFSRAPQANIQRSSFDRSHGVKTTFNAGLLTPFFVDEMLPGDTFHARLHAFVRVNTLIYPLMDNLYFETFWFATPARILWDNWEKFNGAQTNPGDPTNYVIPTVTWNAGFTSGTLPDYMGLPLQSTKAITVNALPFRAYNLIYNEWFRDENLQNSLTVQTDDGPDVNSNYVMRRRGKRYDYFTSCLPFPQKGPAVSLPLGSFAPVISDIDSGGTGVANFSTSTVPSATQFEMTFTNGVPLNQWDGNAPGSGTAYWNTTAGATGLVTDLSQATAATINQLREAFQLQKFYERDARGGTRYTEIMKSHFHVNSPDSRLQRPEYIGGGSTAFNINAVAQTTVPAANTVTNALANLGAYGTCAPKGHGFTYSATEHMYILGIMCVRADLNYQQGIEKLWLRDTRESFYWPVFAHLGEQAVTNKEIYFQGTDLDDEVFGYQERYAEYRYKPSLITGQFRSTASVNYDEWHLAQQFGTLPALNSTFIQESPPMSRVKAVPTAPDFLFDGFISYKCARPMPVYSVPGLVDHF